jgi:hypothetical protein
MTEDELHSISPKGILKGKSEKGKKEKMWVKII